MDSGDDDSSSDDFGSNTRYETSSATTPTYAVSPGVSSSDEGKIKNIIIGSGGAEGSITAPLILEEQRDSNCLDVDRFPDNHVEIEDGAAEDGPQDEDVLEHVGEDTIKDLELDGIRVYGDGSYSKDGHKAGVEGDAEGW